MFLSYLLLYSINMSLNSLQGTYLIDINIIYELNIVKMSDMIAFLCFLFAKIDDKKISGSDVAGYYGEQTVFRTDYFSCFLIVS